MRRILAAVRLALLVFVLAFVPAVARGQFVSITPGGGTMSSTTFSVQILFCGGEYGLNQEDETITLNGNDVSGNFTYQGGATGCGMLPDNSAEAQSALYTGSVTISGGNNTLVASMTANDGGSGYGTAYGQVTWVYTVLGVSVSGGSASVAMNQSGNAGFTVTNTGNTTRTFNLSYAGCNGMVSNCSLGQSSVTLNGGQGTTVNVSYSTANLPGYGGSAVLYLTATDNQTSSSNAQGGYTVNVLTKPVTSVVVTRVSSPSTIGVAQTSQFAVVGYASDGMQLEDRPIGWSGSNVSVSPSTGALSTCCMAATTATGASAGTGTVYATVEGVTGSATVNVVNPTYAMSVTTLSSNPLNPGNGSSATGNITYRIANNNQYVTPSSTFSLSASRTGIVSSCPSLSSVTIAPGSYADVNVNCSIGAVTTPSTGTVTLSASTSSPASLSGSYTTTVNVNPYHAIVVSPLVASRTEDPQTSSNTLGFRIYNYSVNAGGSASISYSNVCTGVTSCGGGSSVSVNEGSYTDVTLGYGIAWVGTTGTVGISASLGASSSTNSTSIATTPTYGVTVVRENGSQTLGGGATSGSTRFTIHNTSTNTGSNRTFDLGASCTGPFVTGCSPSASSITLADQASSSTNAITITYSTALTGQSGTVTLTASAASPGNPSHAQTTTVNATPVHAVAVTPTAPTSPLAESANSGTATFTIQNTSTNTTASAVTFTLIASCNGVTNCSYVSNTVSLSQGQSASRSVGFTVSPEGTSGEVWMNAQASSPVSFQQSGMAPIQTTPHKAVLVTVTPTQLLQEQSTGGSTTFTVMNAGRNLAEPTMYNLARSCSGSTLTSCTTPNPVTLAYGGSTTVTIGYDVGSTGTGGNVELSATVSGGSYNSYATQAVTVDPYYAVQVSQSGGNPQTLGARVTGGSSTFQVQNAGRNLPGSVTFSLEPYGCSGITTCVTSASSMTLAQGASGTVDVNYGVSSTLISGIAGVRVWTTTPEYLDQAITKTINTTPSYSIAVTPGTGADTTAAGIPGTYSATIANTSWNTPYPITVSLATPGCSGSSYVSSCAIGSNSNSVAQGASSPAITLSYNGVAVGTHSGLALNASGSVSQGGSVAATNGAVNLVVATGGTISAVTASLNPRARIDRAGCLAIAAGQGAAYECSDLRLAHSLPATTTMGKARVPRLIYNSRHAKPGVLLAANVTFNGAVQPDTIEATVTISGEAGTIVKAYPTGSACTGQGCRIVVPIDAGTGFGTGPYQANLQVRAKSGGYTFATSSTVSDTVTFVNRSQSPYGAGWWVDGLESMWYYGGSNRVFWAGGDGSTKLYEPTSNANVYVAQAFDRPDTIVRVDTIWRRMLGDSGWVEFNSLGKHVKTRNGLGWQTTFSYHDTLAGRPLDKITLPVPSGGPTLQYVFKYTVDGSGLPALDTVIAPAAAVARKVRTTRANHFQVTGFVDPDNAATAFSYASSSSNRVVSRRSKLGDTTHFAYDDGGALKQFRVDTATGAGTGVYVTTDIRAAETRSTYDGADGVTVPSSLYTYVYGPRAGVNDNMTFFLNRWGAPEKIANAAGDTSRIFREHSTFPALVTRSVAPGGLETRAHFNARALVDSTEVIDPNEAGCNGTTDRSCIAVTRYRWHPIWNGVVSTRTPAALIDSAEYSGAAPRLNWIQRVVSGSRITFAYGGTGQIARVQQATGERDSVLYNALGNDSVTISPTGFRSYRFQNAIGQDIKVAVPQGDTTLARMTTYADTGYLRTTITYDAAGRALSTVQQGSKLASAVTVDNNPLKVENLYDAAGNIVRVKRMIDTVGTVAMVDTFTYDGANRQTAARHAGSAWKTFAYDAAGNVTTVTNGRGKTVWLSYDSTGRLTQRITPRDSVPLIGCATYIASPTSCSWSLPAFCVDADTATFGYNTAGLMVRADNRYARVRRGYNKGGLLTHDTLRVRTYHETGSGTCAPASGTYAGVEWDYHVYTMQHTYDVDGRRTHTKGPYSLSGCSTSPCTTQWAWNDRGENSSVQDGMGRTIDFTYDDKSRLTNVVYPNGVDELRQYDAEGRVYDRSVTSGSVPVLQDLMHFSARDQILRGTLGYRYGSLFNSSADMIYGPFGAVIYSTNAATAGNGAVVTEKLKVNAFGNPDSTYMSGPKLSPHPDSDGRRRHQYDAAGRLQKIERVEDSSSTYSYLLEQRFDSSGNAIERFVRDVDPSGAIFDSERSYYDAADRLVTFRRHIGTGAVSYDQGADRGVHEEYRYDALGRRVLVRSLRGSNCTGIGLGCQDYVQRTVWDGDQIVFEERAPGDAGVTPMEKDSSWVAYVHAASGIDQPLAVMRAGMPGQPAGVTVYPHQNWRGLFELGTMPAQGTPAIGAGTLSKDCQNESGCPKINFPGWNSSLFGMNSGASDSTNWFGSLILGKQDGSGKQYVRNRYLDPVTGKFTQQDPIGLAGGMNLYGYASGDPINRSDPFGLSDCKVIPVTVTDDKGSTTTYVRVCDSQDRSGQDGWKEGNALDKAITRILADKPGAGFAPGLGTVYVNNADALTTLVHEISHEMLARRTPFWYQNQGLAELAWQGVIDPYKWNMKLGWIAGYELQAQEARATTDARCFAGEQVSCMRTPYRYSFP